MLGPLAHTIALVLRGWVLMLRSHWKLEGWFYAWKTVVSCQVHRRKVSQARFWTYQLYRPKDFSWTKWYMEPCCGALCVADIWKLHFLQGESTSSAESESFYIFTLSAFEWFRLCRPFVFGQRSYFSCHGLEKEVFISILSFRNLFGCSSDGLWELFVLSVL